MLVLPGIPSIQMEKDIKKADEQMIEQRKQVLGKCFSKVPLDEISSNSLVVTVNLQSTSIVFYFFCFYWYHSFCFSSITLPEDRWLFICFSHTQVRWDWRGMMKSSTKQWKKITKKLLTRFCGMWIKIFITSSWKIPL